MMKKQCEKYVGISCVDGSCPISNSEEYEERCMPLIKNCKECCYHKGCKDCALYDTEYCDKTDSAANKS